MNKTVWLLILPESIFLFLMGVAIAEHRMDAYPQAHVFEYWCAGLSFTIPFLVFIISGARILGNKAKFAVGAVAVGILMFTFVGPEVFLFGVLVEQRIVGRCDRSSYFGITLAR
jgi:hypothetical protein